METQVTSEKMFYCTIGQRLVPESTVVTVDCHDEHKFSPEALIAKLGEQTKGHYVCLSCPRGITKVKWIDSEGLEHIESVADFIRSRQEPDYNSGAGDTAEDVDQLNLDELEESTEEDPHQRIVYEEEAPDVDNLKGFRFNFRDAEQSDRLGYLLQARMVKAAEEVVKTPAGRLMGIPIAVGLLGITLVFNTVAQVVEPIFKGLVHLVVSPCYGMGCFKVGLYMLFVRLPLELIQSTIFIVGIAIATPIVLIGMFIGYIVDPQGANSVIFKNMNASLEKCNKN